MCSGDSNTQTDWGSGYGDTMQGPSQTQQDLPLATQQHEHHGGNSNTDPPPAYNTIYPLTTEYESGSAARARARPQPRPQSQSNRKKVKDPANWATALYAYEAQEENEISFTEDATIFNVAFPDKDWWSGDYEGKSGLFPANHVKLHKSEAKYKLAIALYDYEAQEENELSFPEHAMVKIMAFPDIDWWYAEYDGKFGLLPADYVELKREK